VSAAGFTAFVRSLRPTRLQSRLMMGMLILLGGFAAVIAVLFPAQMERQSTRELIEKGQSITNVTALGLAAAIVFEDATTIATAVGSVRADEDVQYVVVTERTGRVLGASALERAIAAGYDRAGAATPDQTGGVLRIHAPILSMSDTVGTVWVGMSLAEVRDAVARSRSQVVGLVVIVLLAGALGVYTVSVWVTRPLAMMARVAGEISAGDLGRRVGIGSNDEVGALANAFDDMVDRLASAYGELRGLNSELEARVERRTQELQQAYEERLRAKGALYAAERRFRTMFESSAMGIAMVGPELQLLELNASFVAMFRTSMDRLVGTPLRSLIADDEQDSNYEAFTQLAAGQCAGFQSEIRCVAADGSSVWGHIVASAVSDARGRFDFAIVMFENITEQKQLEEQLRQAQRLEAVGRLAGGVAHDFNNLLTTINGLTELMLMSLDGSEHLREDLLQVRKAGDRAADLTRQLLAFSRRQVLQPRVLDLNANLDDMASMLRRMIGEDVDLIFTLEPGLPPIKADPGQIGQVVMNMAVNARDAMPEGGTVGIDTFTINADIATAGRFDIDPGPCVALRVSDTGHGMDAVTLQHMFEPFFTTKDVGQGTGLGLATVYGIVKQSGGGIVVQSEPGLGAIFTILFPALAVDCAVQATKAPAPAPPRGTEALLVVEDEEGVRRLLARVLRKQGYKVLEAGDGVQAIDIVQSSNEAIAAVVTDVIMPAMSGPRMMERLDTVRPGLRVLYLSGYPREELAMEDLDEGRSAFLPKPVSPEMLCRTVRELIDGRRFRPGN